MVMALETMMMPTMMMMMMMMSEARAGTEERTEADFMAEVDFVAKTEAEAEKVHLSEAVASSKATSMSASDPFLSLTFISNIHDAPFAFPLGFETSPSNAFQPSTPTLGYHSHMSTYSIPAERTLGTLSTHLPPLIILLSILVSLLSGPTKRLRTRLAGPFVEFLKEEELVVVDVGGAGEERKKRGGEGEERETESEREGETETERERERETETDMGIRRTCRVLVSVACLETAAWLGLLVYTATHTPKTILQPLTMSLSWAYVSLHTQMRPPRSTPLLFVSFAALQAFLCVILFLLSLATSSSSSSTFGNPLDILTFSLSVVGPGIWTCVAGTLPLSPSKPSPFVAGRKDSPSSELTMPEDDLTLWSWCSFTFVQPLLSLALQRRLNETDVWSLSPYFSHQNLFTKLLQEKNPNESLLRFLITSNALDLLICLSAELWGTCIGFVPPFALQKILSCLSSERKEERDLAYVWTLVTFVAHLSFAQVDLFEGWYGRRCYERTRGQIFCALHWKALMRRERGGHFDDHEHENENASGEEVGEKARRNGDEPADLGKILNLMQGDAYAVAQRFWEFSPVLVGPIRMGIAMWFLYSILGWSSFAGVAFVLVAFALNYPLARWNVSITESSARAKDRRMNTVNELLQNIRFLKFYGWEFTWSRKAEKAREEELWWRVKLNVVDTMISFIWIWLPSATALTCFLCFTLVAGEKLTVSKAFTSIALFSYLQGPMVEFPNQIMALLQAHVSMKRIDAYLAEEQVPEWACSLLRPESQSQSGTPPGDEDDDNDLGPGFKDAVFQWDSGNGSGAKGGSGSSTPSPASSSSSSLNGDSTPYLEGDANVDANERTPLLPKTRASPSPSSSPSPSPSLNQNATTTKTTTTLQGSSKHGKHSKSHFVLGPLDIRFPKGVLTILAGPTGSGKSAILCALLGEMHCVRGQVKMDKGQHRVAYCGQTPWLEHATIRDNITFHSSSSSPFDTQRYAQVLDACALRPDLSILPGGDLTEIGEKGITLSGGQRARVALARALYSQAEVVLLDDPLAAVDMHTAEHIVRSVFGGELVRGRTVVVVTHHVALCRPFARFLVEVGRGRVVSAQRLNPTMMGPLPPTPTQPLPPPTPPPTLIPDRDVTGSKDHRVQIQVRDVVVEVVDDAYASDVDSDASTARPLILSDSPDPDLHHTSSLLELDTGKLLLASGKLVEAEARAEGRVSLKSYWTYIRAAGLWAWVMTFVLLVLIRVINVGNQFFLSKWGRAYEDYPPFLGSSMPPIATANIFPHLPPPQRDVIPWLMIYLYISTAGAFSVLFYIALGYYASLQASRSLFLSLLHRITRAPTRFFDVTPTGRILNRFTTDINTIDSALQSSARSCLGGTLNFLASFGVMLFLVPSFVPFALGIAWLYVRIAPEYVQAARDLRRLESVALSPAFAGFDEVLRGIVHIRAFGMERKYQERFYKRVDRFQSFDHVYWLVNGWLRWRYDCLGSLVVVAATMFALLSGTNDGLSAIVIVQAGIFADASRQLVKAAAQLELDFNSVERVIEYLDVPQEREAVVKDCRPPPGWLTGDLSESRISRTSPGVRGGGIKVEGLYVRYAEGLPDVLRGVGFEMSRGMKVGVVGRTGSGKSTLAMALLRIVEPSAGRIIIDGVDICSLGLEDLRTRVTLVSQDVSLFAGTIRSNLDPLERHTDEECLAVLERVHLLRLLRSRFVHAGDGDGDGDDSGPFVAPPQTQAHTQTQSHTQSYTEPQSHPEPNILSMKITRDSLSAGEKQLLSLSRALLRKSHLIIMDEATSQIDLSLDDQIQQTLRLNSHIDPLMKDAMILTIAHRLETVLDYDRVLVLDKGRVVEYDEPRVLLVDEEKYPDGAFRAMCRKSPHWGTGLFEKVVRGEGVGRQVMLTAASATTTTTTTTSELLN